jgi:hypothetical protein
MMTASSGGSVCAIMELRSLFFGDNGRMPGSHIISPTSLFVTQNDSGLTSSTEELFDSFIRPVHGSPDIVL